MRADEYPDFESPTIEEGKFQGVIETGLMLCRIQRKRYLKELLISGSDPQPDESR